VLQCVAVCCNALQCVAECVLQCAAVCNRALRSVAVCCSALQCVAAQMLIRLWSVDEVCCSVLQSACCSVLQRGRGAVSQGTSATLSDMAHIPGKQVYISIKKLKKNKSLWV